MGKSILVWVYTPVMLLLAMSFFGCTEAQMRDAGVKSSGISTSSASSRANAPVVDVASGTQGDSLAACLGRIPDNATAGQRQLAEMSCQRDERSRQPIASVPGQ